MRYVFTVILLLMLSGLCQAAVLSVAVETADVVNFPVDVGGDVVLQVPRYYPLISDSEESDFYQVSDFQGRTGWVRKVHVDQTRSVVVVVPTANVRERPGTSHRILFKASKGVAFKVLDETQQWFKVEHEGGKRGWIAKSLTWGS